MRRHELQAYGRHGALPSPFFARRLDEMASDVVTLNARARELTGAVESRHKAPLDITGLHELLSKHKALFDHMTWLGVGLLPPMPL